MAARVNSRFIIIMLVCVALGAAAVWGIWYVQVRGDAERLARQGDEQFAQGEWNAAMLSYSRASRRDPGNVEYLRKVEASIMQQRPETTEEAHDLYTRWMTVLRQEANFRAAVPESHLRLLNELHSAARLQAQLAGTQPLHLWREIVLAADQMLERVPESEAERAYGRLYRGMARLHLRGTLSAEELADAEQDLIEFNARMPNHDLGWASLARGQMLLEEHARLSGDPRRIAQRQSRLHEVMEEARTVVPGGPEVSTVYAAYLAERAAGAFGSPRGGVSATELNQALDSMSDVIASLEPDDVRAQWLVLEAVRVLRIARGLDGIPGAVRLVRQHLDRDPDALVHRYTLANLHLHARELDLAESLVEEVLAAGPLTAGFLSRVQSNIRQAAAALATDVAFQRWSLAGGQDADGSVRPVHIEAMRNSRDRLRRYVVDPEANRTLIRADGMLALMEERYHDAAAKLERLIREGVNAPEVLTGSAFALYRTGEIGLAHERAAAAADMARGQAPGLLLLKAQIEFQLRRLDAAASTIDEYLVAYPEDENALRLSRAIHLAATGVTFDADDPAQAVMHQAQNSLNEGTPEGVESARVALLGGLEVAPDEPRLLGMLATVLMHMGDTQGAREIVERALEIAPDAALIRQLEAMVRTGDPIEAMFEFFATVEDETDRTATLLVSLESLRAQEESTAARQRDVGRLEVAEQAAELAARAEEESRNVEKRLRELAPDHPVLIEFEFTRAVQERDWNRAGRIVERAAAANVDQANGLLYEGRLELERRPPRLEHAVRAFQRATDLRPSSAAWRGLGMAYQGAGNFREALRAYERSYNINPNDVSTARLYLGLLMQTGDRTRALRVARDAARAMPGDTAIRELWLELETEVNNHVVVLQRRTEIYEASPSDRVNAQRLALALVATEPAYEMLLDEHGNRAFPERQWNAMRRADQNHILEEARSQWHQIAWRIVEDQERRFGRDVETVSLRAEMMKTKGDIRGGERVLREFVAEIRERESLSEGQRSPALTSAMLALGTYQVRVGQASEAAATYRRATAYQDPVDREADLVLADHLFDRGGFEEARALYEDVSRVSESRSVELRLVDCDINLGDYDSAERRLQRLMADRNDFTTEMLRASIAQGRAEAFSRANRRSDAERQWEVFRAAIAAAQRMDPANPRPHIQRSRAAVLEYRRTNQRSLIDEALAALDAAEAVRAGDPAVSLGRVEVLRESGNRRGAINELRRLLDRFPEQHAARQMLVQSHVEGGNLAAALETVREAVDRFPAMAGWYELKGELHSRQQPPDFAAAAAAYRQAYELSGSPTMLHRKLGTYLRRAPHASPDYAAAIRLLQNEADAVERDPSLETVWAHALAASGRSEEGRQRLGRSYQRLQSSITGGDRHPAEIGAWYQAAAPMFATWTVDELQALFDGVGASDPTGYETLWRARSLAGRGAVGMSRAVALYREAAESTVARSDEDFRSTVLFELSGLQIAMEEYTAAAETLREIISLRPSHWVALNNLAFLKTSYLGDASGGLRHAQAALDLRPGDASILDTVGWTYFKLGQYDRAEEYLRESLTSRETAQTQLHMAHVLAATGRYEAAQSRLRRAAELNPDPKTQADVDRLADDIRTKRAQAQ